MTNLLEEDPDTSLRGVSVIPLDTVFVRVVFPAPLVADRLAGDFTLAPVGGRLATPWLMISPLATENQLIADRPLSHHTYTASVRATVFRD